MNGVLDALWRQGVLSPLDRHFALALGRLAPEPAPEVLLGAALASRAVQHGHVCADLARLGAVPLLDAEEQPVADLELPELDAWCEALRRSPLVGGGEPRTPLVLESPGRLYLYRYWDHQRRLAGAIRARLGAVEEVDEAVLREGLERLFPGAGETDPQRRAAEVAVRRRFSVISGGPGTGKTSTVAVILALLQEQARALRGETLRVLLLTPTGKAAQRLGQAIEEKVGELSCDDAVRDAIPGSASTIHRALGYQPRTPTRYRHGPDEPLAADVVLVDEASMVDLALMAKLADAVPASARLVLLGDRDQLASVEAGAIFGDLCAAEEGERGAGIVHLTHSYRYGRDSGIGVLARAVNAGDGDAALAALRSPEHADLSLAPLADPAELDRVLAPLLQRHLGELVGGSPAETLRRLGRFRILCAHRRGPLGAEAVGAAVERHLHERGAISVDEEYYEGRPIMVLQNDYQLDLFNGDTGVIAHDPETGRRAAFFPGLRGGEPRRFAPGRLPPHETVFATTVHKSQGSEYDHVAVLLPETASPVLTRELVYTGVTRARRGVTLLAGEDVLRAALSRRIDRASGLREALWS